MLLHVSRTNTDTVTPSHFPSQHASWSGRGHSAGETCPFQQGFCPPPSSFFKQSTFHPACTPTTFFFFFLNPHCLLFTRLNHNSVEWSFLKKCRHQNILFRGLKEISSRRFLSAHCAKVLNNILYVRPPKPWISISRLLCVFVCFVACYCNLADAPLLFFLSKKQFIYVFILWRLHSVAIMFIWKWRRKKRRISDDPWWRWFIKPKPGIIAHFLSFLYL